MQFLELCRVSNVLLLWIWCYDDVERCLEINEDIVNLVPFGPPRTEYNNSKLGRLYIYCLGKRHASPSYKNLSGLKLLKGDNLLPHCTLTALEWLKPQDTMLIWLPPISNKSCYIIFRWSCISVKSKKRLTSWEETNVGGTSTCREIQYFLFLPNNIPIVTAS